MKTKKKRGIFIPLLVSVLIFAFVLKITGLADVIIQELFGDLESSEWDELVLGDKLPVCKNEISSVWDNTKSVLHIRVDMNNKQFYDYLDECKTYGYDIDACEEDTEYYAFNADGYLIYLDKTWSDSLWIELYAPMKTQDIDWQINDLTDIIPLPKSNIGEVVVDWSWCFEVIVTEITFDEYKTYIEECKEAGYNIDINISSEYSYNPYEEYKTCYNTFSAYDENGNRMLVSYIGADRISVTISMPRENTEDEIEADPEYEYILEIEPEPTPIANGARDADGYDDVKNIQLRLIELGYLSGGADGIFGSGTEKALKEFQEKNGLDVTGVADYSTISDLESTYAIPKNEPQEVENYVEDTDEEGEELVDGMRPSVKEAIDSFENYFIEYCDLMEKMANNPDDPLVLVDYAEFFATYADTLRDFENMEDEDLNDAEMAYYLAALGRVNQMLINAAYEVDY